MKSMGLNYVRYFDCIEDNFDEIIAMDRCKLNERNVYKLEEEYVERVDRYVFYFLPNLRIFSCDLNVSKQIAQSGSLSV